jgi:hypothetical protein
MKQRAGQLSVCELLILSVLNPDSQLVSMMVSKAPAIKCPQRLKLEQSCCQEIWLGFRRGTEVAQEL